MLRAPINYEYGLSAELITTDSLFAAWLVMCIVRQFFFCDDTDLINRKRIMGLLNHKCNPS